MNTRWWDVEFYAERAKQPGCLTAIMQFGAGIAIVPHDQNVGQLLLLQLAESAAKRNKGSR